MPKIKFIGTEESQTCGTHLACTKLDDNTIHIVIDEVENEYGYREIILDIDTAVLFKRILGQEITKAKGLWIDKEVKRG